MDEIVQYSGRGVCCLIEIFEIFETTLLHLMAQYLGCELLFN